MEDNYKNNMVFGIHPVLETLNAQKEIEKVFIQAGTRSPELTEIANACRKIGVPVQYVPMEKMNRLTRKNHQGVVAFICPIEYRSLEYVVQAAFEEARDPFILILDRVTDVRNFGAIARTAYAAGVDAIVIPSKGSALINGDAMKTSAGALSLISVCRVENLKDAIDFLKASGLRVVGLTEKAHESLWNADLTGPLCVMMGSEEDGISPAYLKRLDQHLMIPMPGDIDSLNVSVATGVVCFEVVKQRMG
ncbi:MAG: 23S rRNA (guanosine(2251)-2'-O)-methyltransferase RlmB [Bacteroidales bacterium]|nr:23S rRNA (guanosine(2251)-2'-O)-methyltransferase RlmB [Bacteroidales bacterium]